jgi:hypothetical protein
MYLSILDSAEKVAAEGLTIDAASLYRVFEHSAFRLPPLKVRRLEVRAIWTSTQMNDWFETEWAGVAQVFRLRHCVKERDKEREEIVYGVTNLPRKKANASRLLALQQAPFLRPSRGSLAVTVSQAFAVVRVHQKALGRILNLSIRVGRINH